jgi:hypothetical protein
MKKITEVDQLEIGKEYYLELYGSKVKAYITDIVESPDLVFFSFPCLLSGEGYFRDVHTVSKQMRCVVIKQVIHYNKETRETIPKFHIINELYYNDSEDEDDIIEITSNTLWDLCLQEYSGISSINIYEPTRDKLYEKFKQTSLELVMEKYTFPGLYTEFKELL